MIALDTSALLAVYLAEDDADLFERVIFRSDGAVLGAPTALEFLMVATARRACPAGSDGDPRRLLSQPRIRVLPWGPDHLPIAHRAFQLFGKGRGHPAQLNFGDCLSYATARALDIPLLFKGSDFSHTDVTPAVA